MATRYLNMSYSERLTVNEAHALLYAAEGVLDHPDAFDAVFGKSPDGAAARRAAAKLTRALRRAVNRPAKTRPTGGGS